MSTKEAIMESIEKLNGVQQEKLLEFINAITTTGYNPYDVLKFADIMDNASVSEMEKAILNDCERVDINEW